MPVPSKFIDTCTFVSFVSLVTTAYRPGKEEQALVQSSEAICVEKVFLAVAYLTVLPCVPAQ
jgi:hypothetical protein